MEEKKHPITIPISDNPLLQYWAERASKGRRGYMSDMVRKAVEHFVTEQTFLNIAALHYPEHLEGATYPTSIVFRSKNEPMIEHWIGTLKDAGMSVSKSIKYIMTNSIKVVSEEEGEYLIEFDEVPHSSVVNANFEQALLQKTMESTQQVASVLKPELITRRKNMATIISVANQKGGVGKTITSVNLAAGLVEAGKKTLLIDCDPQGSVSSYLGYEKNTEEFTLKSLGTALMQMAIGVPYDVKASIVHDDKTGLDMILSNISLSNTESFLTSHPKSDVKHYSLKKLIDPIRNEYDYIILDTPPNLHAITISALACSDNVLIPCEPASLPIDAFKQLISTIMDTQKSINPSLVICGLIITQTRARYVNDVDGAEYIRETFGKYIRVYDFEIPSSVHVEDAVKLHDSIYHVAPREKVAHLYRKLTEEVMNYGK